MATPSHTVVVVGGAGAMGQITVRDLFETAPHMPIVIADYNAAAARALARSYRSPRVRGVGLDVTDIAATTHLLRGAFAVVCAVQYQHNVAVMQAAHSAKVHFCDLGGLFHVTRQQMAWHRRFAQIDRLALLGIGAAPGITNLLAARAATVLDTVEQIHIRVAGVDHTPMSSNDGIGISYSLQTVLEEASKPAAVFTDGKFTFVAPLSHADPEIFPRPVGKQHPAATLHSEVATLPLSYRKKGIREVTFRIAFDPATTARLRFLHSLGFTQTDPIDVGDVSVPPMQVLLRLLQDAPKPTAQGPIDQYEVLRAIVIGKRGRERQVHTVDCHVPGIPAWNLGVDVDTGCPPSIAMQLLSAGTITARGAMAAERAIPLKPFFTALRARGMRLRHRQTTAPPRR